MAVHQMAILLVLYLLIKLFSLDRKSIMIYRLNNSTVDHKTQGYVMVRYGLVP